MDRSDHNDALPVLSPDMDKKEVDKFFQIIFNLADEDGDGLLNIDEYKLAFRLFAKAKMASIIIHSMGEEKAESAKVNVLASIDKTHDGEVIQNTRAKEFT